MKILQIKVLPLKLLKVRHIYDFVYLHAINYYASHPFSSNCFCINKFMTKF